MLTHSDCLDRARRCMELAGEASPDRQDVLFNIAAAWLKLAQTQEKLLAARTPCVWLPSKP